MKKIFFCLLGVFFNYSHVMAQSFTIPADTINVTVTGSVPLHNDITNISTSPTTVKWNVMSHDFPTDWSDNVGICDNNLCYYNFNNSLFNGSIKTTNPIAASETAIFYLLPDLTAASPGSHYVQIRMRDTATTLNCVYIVNKFPTGLITTTKSEDIITLYPNPVSNIVNLIVDITGGKKVVAIYNVSGILMHKVSLETAKTQLDLSFLPGGLYVIRLSDEKGLTIATSTFSRI